MNIDEYIIIEEIKEQPSQNNSMNISYEKLINNKTPFKTNGNIKEDMDYTKLSVMKFKESQSENKKNLMIPSLSMTVETPFFILNDSTKEIQINKRKTLNLQKIYKDVPPKFESTHIFLLKNSIFYWYIFIIFI